MSAETVILIDDTLAESGVVAIDLIQHVSESLHVFNYRLSELGLFLHELLDYRCSSQNSDSVTVTQL